MPATYVPATSSWLLSAPLRFSRSVPPRDARDPRWSTVPPTATSSIPPPIVKSVYSSRSPASANRPPPFVRDDAAWYRRVQQQLERDLQILLDAQAEGLSMGLDRTAADDDAASTGSSTPTAHSLHLRDLGQARPRPAKFSLRAARKGLYSTMRKLALLKADQSRQLDPELEECNTVTAQIESWAKKQSGLQERLQKIQQGEEHQKVARLRQEANGLQTDINDVEARLADLKRTQRRLMREADEVENGVQAKLSSYKTSLGLLEANIKRFMRESQQDASETRPPPSDSDKLDSARQSWARKRAVLVREQESAESEREALEEGAVVWRDVVKEVSEFEIKLRQETAILQRPKEGERASNSMLDLLAKMDQTTMQLESKLGLAEVRNWNLLICAIGAELEAFSTGREILEAALGAAGHTLDDEDSDDLEFAKDGSVSTLHPAADSMRDRGEEIRYMDHAFDAPQRLSGVSDTDTDDDGPDPELLISHQDTDTE